VAQAEALLGSIKDIQTLAAAPNRLAQFTLPNRLPARQKLRPQGNPSQSLPSPVSPSHGRSRPSLFLSTCGRGRGSTAQPLHVSLGRGAEGRRESIREQRLRPPPSTAAATARACGSNAAVLRRPPCRPQQRRLGSRSPARPEAHPGGSSAWVSPLRHTQRQVPLEQGRGGVGLVLLSYILSLAAYFIFCLRCYKSPTRRGFCIIYCCC
jgi:hypothetical protein